MEKAKQDHESKWRPDANTKHQMESAKRDAREGGCNALKSALYQRTVFPHGAHERAIDFETNAVCAGMHKGFHGYLAPHRGHGFSEQLGQLSWSEANRVALAQQVGDRMTPWSQSRHRPPEEEIQSYEGPLHYFVHDVFMHANWQHRAPGVRARIERRISQHPGRWTWRLIDPLRANRAHVAPYLRRIQAQSAHVDRYSGPGWEPGGWARNALVAAMLTAADVAEALFPQQCRLAGFRRQDVARHGAPLLPPVAVPAHLVDRTETRFAAEYGRELRQLAYRRPQPNPERIPPRPGVPFPDGVPKADLLAPPRQREGPRRLNSA